MIFFINEILFLGANGMQLIVKALTVSPNAANVYAKMMQSYSINAICAIGYLFREAQEDK